MVNGVYWVRKCPSQVIGGQIYSVKSVKLVKLDNVIPAPSAFRQRLKHFCSRPRSLTLSLIPGKLFPTSSGSWSDFITWITLKIHDWLIEVFFSLLCYHFSHPGEYKNSDVAHPVRENWLTNGCVYLPTAGVTPWPRKRVVPQDRFLVCGSVDGRWPIDHWIKCGRRIYNDAS